MLEGHVDGKAMKAVRFAGGGPAASGKSKAACRPRSREGQGAAACGRQGNEGGAFGGRGQGAEGRRGVTAKVKAACRHRHTGGGGARGSSKAMKAVRLGVGEDCF